jgi:acyl carrier protein
VKEMNIEAKLQEVLAKKVKDITLDKTATLESLGLDSLDKIDLLYEIEDVFGIEFSNEEMTSFVTVGDIYNTIEAKI